MFFKGVTRTLGLIYFVYAVLYFLAALVAPSFWLTGLWIVVSVACGGVGAVLFNLVDCDCDKA